MHVYDEVHVHMVHARGMPVRCTFMMRYTAHEVHAREMHTHEVHACEMHVYEIHTNEMDAGDVHAYEVYKCEALATVVAHGATSHCSLLGSWRHSWPRL
jgi:hypothetical protein